MSETKPNKHQESVSHNEEIKSAVRRPYTPPRVLSAEPLEAAAVTCDPPEQPFGKSLPIPCTTLGS
jgi:hypothetical protein